MDKASFKIEMARVRTLQPYVEAFDRLDTTIAEGRLARGEWIGTDAQGRETACLIAALWPEAGEDEDAGACPADLLPPWLAHLVPWMDDAPSDEAWPTLMRRTAATLRQLHRLDSTALRRVEYRHRATCVREAAQHTADASVLTVCDMVATLCDRVVDGDEPDDDEWSAAEAAAWAESSAAEAASAAAAAASAATWAAEAASWSAAESSASWSAAEAAWAATEAADRIVGALLDSIDDEIRRAA